MDVSLFDYDLPEGLIAQQAVQPRDAARLLVLHRDTGRVEHHHVHDLPELLAPNDLLVVNDTRVTPARLFGHKPSGGRVEVFLLERLCAASPGSEIWRALIRASRVPKEGAILNLGGNFRAIIARAVGSDGVAQVRLEEPGGVSEAILREGVPPLPPYIRRERDDPRTEGDRERYQTIFAKEEGAVAAPTAGLHFTPELVNRLAGRGVDQVSLTLHVGEGTFRTLRETRLEKIKLHPERFRVSGATSRSIARTRETGGRVIAVGTTVTRTLEARPLAPDGGPEPGEGSTSLFISPGHEFRFVDILMTNFHLPQSTLLMLVSAFAGREKVLAAYAEAVEQGYRFYSYGDAMLVL